MSKKPKSRANSRNKSKNRLESLTAITTNPFLNFFLTKCGVKANSKLHRFAKAIGSEWTNMNYHEKSPYYELADKARKKRIKLLTKSVEKDDRKKVMKEVKPDEIIREVVNEHKMGCSVHFENIPEICAKNISEDEILVKNSPATPVLETWLAETEFVTPQIEIEPNLQPPCDGDGSTHVSIAASFHSMKNNCCSQINVTAD